MKITRLIRTGGKGRTEKGKGKRREKKFRTDAFAMPYRSPSISGAPDRIDPTSGSGNGFSPGWRAEACRFDRGDRSRSGSCNENVNRCLDMLRTCVHPFGSADRSYSIVVPGPGVFQPPLCTLPRIYSRCVSSWPRGEGNAPFQYQFPSHFICADSKQTVPPGTPPISSPLYAIDIDKFDLLTIGESLFSALINDSRDSPS